MKRRNFAKKILVVIAVILIAMSGGMVIASSGGDHAEGHAEEHHAESKGWVATDTYRVMNFGVLAIGLFLLLRKPVKQALGARITDIKDQLKTLEFQKKEAEAKIAEYDKKLATLNDEAEKIVADYVQMGEASKAKILEEAAKMADKLQDQAKKNMEQEFKQAKQALQEEVYEKATEMAEKIIKNKITSKDQDRLVGEYIEKVVA